MPILSEVEASMAQESRTCELCHLVVGTYEPAVFVLGERVIHSSRAADPELSQQPGCRTLHAGCYAQQPLEAPLRAAG
jgi:hypothetical protein